MWPKKKKSIHLISQEVHSLVGKKANKYKTIKSYKIKIVQTGKKKKAVGSTSNVRDSEIHRNMSQVTLDLSPKEKQEIVKMK